MRLNFNRIESDRIKGGAAGGLHHTEREDDLPCDSAGKIDDGITYVPT